MRGGISYPSPFTITHSTLLTRATEFARKARGAAMSLVALPITCLLSYALIRDHVVEENELLEQVVN
jgi:hypothetical protein